MKNRGAKLAKCYSQCMIVSKSQMASVSTTYIYFIHATLSPVFMSHAMVITDNTTSITMLREVTFRSSD